MVRSPGTERRPIVQRIDHPDLGNASYLVRHRREGWAFVVDPVRDMDVYRRRMAEDGGSLDWVFETHLHNDFLSGGRELAARTGARLGAAAAARLRFPYVPLSDRREIRLDGWRLRVLASPGHTPEHLSYLLLTPDGSPACLFSGGALMAGTAARPDLLGPAETLPLARQEWTTLRRRFQALPDSLTVHPTHLGGSFCGVGARAASRTTLGRERRTNRLLTAPTYSAFLERYLSTDPFPSYYGAVRRRNQLGAPRVGDPLPPIPRLSAARVERLLRQRGGVALDTRTPEQFDRGHLPGSRFVGHDGPITAWIAAAADPRDRIVLVGERESEIESARRSLLRIGFDRIEGALDGGVRAWASSGRPLKATRRSTMAELRKSMERGGPLAVVDVRAPSEFAWGHVPGAFSSPVDRLARSDLRDRIPPGVPVYVHCEYGTRSAVAVGLLESMGVGPVVHVLDGPTRWNAPRRRSPTPT